MVNFISADGQNFQWNIQNICGHKWETMGLKICMGVRPIGHSMSNQSGI